MSYTAPYLNLLVHPSKGCLAEIAFSDNTAFCALIKLQIINFIIIFGVGINKEYSMPVFGFPHPTTTSGLCKVQ